MSRKTHNFSAAALVAATGLTFASANYSGAFAQDAEEASSTGANGITPIAADAPGETVPVPQFVANEVVQPIGQAEQASAAVPANAASLGELVSQTDTAQELSEQMHCLAGAIYFESRGEPLAGQLAVAQVIINRTDNAAFPSSYCGVVYQRSQFSFVRKGAMPPIRTGSKAWQRAKAIARIAHEGLWQSQAADSLYFHAKYVRPSWSRKKIARARISTHIFYR